MGERRRVVVRVILAALAVIHAGTGAVLTLRPRWFHDTVVGVAERGPYNEHLLIDLGGMYLALGVLAGWAAGSVDATLQRAAACCLGLVATLHLIFHATHLHGLSAAEAAGELAAIAVMVLLPAVALIVARPALAARAGD